MEDVVDSTEEEAKYRLEAKNTLDILLKVTDMTLDEAKEYYVREFSKMYPEYILRECVAAYEKGQ